MHFYRLLGNHIASHSYIYTYMHTYIHIALGINDIIYVCMYMYGSPATWSAIIHHGALFEYARALQSSPGAVLCLQW